MTSLIPASNAHKCIRMKTSLYLSDWKLISSGSTLLHTVQKPMRNSLIALSRLNTTLNHFLRPHASLFIDEGIWHCLQGLLILQTDLVHAQHFLPAFKFHQIYGFHLAGVGVWGLQNRLASLWGIPENLSCQGFTFENQIRLHLLCWATSSKDKHTASRR